MNITDPDFNKDRNRYYGVRVGDIVGSTQYRFGKMLLAKVIEYGLMDNNKVHVRILGTKDKMECVAEWLTVLLPIETPAEKAEIDNIPSPPQLITEQFLISKGWVKNGAMIHIYDLPKTEFECEMIADEEDQFDNIFVIMSFGERVYSGAIPTESQYEVLNQLLKLHP